jgi:hypothetical protein
LLAGETRVKLERGRGGEPYERDRGDFRKAGTLIFALIDKQKHTAGAEIVGDLIQTLAVIYIALLVCRLERMTVRKNQVPCILVHLALKTKFFLFSICL